jgi:hypothetical protein
MINQNIIQAQDEYDTITEDYRKKLDLYLKVKREMDDLIRDEVKQYEERIKPLLPYLNCEHKNTLVTNGAVGCDDCGKILYA